MKFRLSHLLWLLTLAGAFFAGLLAPASLKPKPLEPVVVAAIDLDHRSVISKSNTKEKLVPADEVPESAVASIRQIRGGYLLERTSKDSIIDQTKVYFDSERTAIPPDYSAYTVKLDSEMDSFALRLLRLGDLVSVHQNDKCLLGSARIYAVFPGNRTACLLVNKTEADELSEAVSEDGGLTLGIPVKQPSSSEK